jgi:hypothetical protein
MLKWIIFANVTEDFGMSDSFTWKLPYLAAFRETDKEKLTELVHATETAIFQRQQEIAGLDDHYDEQLELRACCECLLSIQINKLGWPSSLSSIPSPQND